MLYVCDRCGKSVPKLIPIDDADASAEYSGLIGVPFPCTDYLCVTCAREFLGISDADLIRDERLRNLETVFLLNQLKSRLAYVIIETIFHEFGYEVYPYGYESYFTNIIKDLKKSNANIPVRKMRATPDLFIYDKELNHGFFLEIKATNTRNESRFWISKSTLKSYGTYWKETVLVIYCIPSMNIYCCPITDIHIEKLPVERPGITNDEKCVLNLKDDFQTLPFYFRLIEPNRYAELCEKIQGILKQYSQL